MSVTREQIFTALFGLVSTGEGRAGRITWGAGESLAYTSRRVRLWDDLPAQPALCQAEHKESFTQAARMPSLRRFSAAWLIYHTAGRDKDAVPAVTDNQIMDAVEAVFTPTPSDPGFPDERLTLGGLVHHCWIDGEVFKDPGDLDGQGLLVVPITILVP